MVLTTQDSNIFLVNAKTGRELLFYDTGYVRLGGGAVIGGDRAYFPSDRGWLWAIYRGARGYPFERAIWRLKFNLYVGQIIKSNPTQQVGPQSSLLGGDLTFTPALAHDTLYIANTDGMVFARDAVFGGERWTSVLNAEVTTSPTVAGQTVLLGTKDGRSFGLDAQTGAIRWSFRNGDDEISASPIVVGVTIYVVSLDGTPYPVDGKG